MKIYQKVIDSLLNASALRATMFIDPNLIVRATRRKYNNKFNKQVELVVTIGKPNVRERKFIKDCIKAGEKFPIKKVQLKFLPVKKK